MRNRDKENSQGFFARKDEEARLAARAAALAAHQKAVAVRNYERCTGPVQEHLRKALVVEHQLHGVGTVNQEEVATGKRFVAFRPKKGGRALVVGVTALQPVRP